MTKTESNSGITELSNQRTRGAHRLAEWNLAVLRSAA